MKKKKEKKREKNSQKSVKRESPKTGVFVVLLLCLIVAGLIWYVNFFQLEYHSGVAVTATSTDGQVTKGEDPPKKPTLNKKKYDALMLSLANRPKPKVITVTSTSSDGTVITSTTTEKVNYLWPAQGDSYPNYGALLPFNRIVAYYGNFYSTRMGILGEYPKEVVLGKLKQTVAKWEKADPSTPVIPAIDYIAFTAQASAGPDGDYSLPMPDSQMEKAISMAKEINGIVFLEVQAGTGSLQADIESLQKFLKLPQVHLAIDPEFNMKYGHRPGEYIGTVDASDINKAAAYLAGLVKEYHLPPKILVVHQFTTYMVTHPENIKPLPQVQIVVDMDGWGSKAKKRNTYHRVIYSSPVQFAGFKVFYKNDLKPPSTGLMTPEEILQLRPKPIYIQYQ